MFLGDQSQSVLPLSAGRRCGQNLIVDASYPAGNLTPPESRSGSLKIPSSNYEVDVLGLMDTS
jgi:hypothetical protein